MEGRYSEVEKKTLLIVFSQMLEEGMDYFTAEVIEFKGLGELLKPNFKRKRFFIRIQEDLSYGRD